MSQVVTAGIHPHAHAERSHIVATPPAATPRVIKGTYVSGDEMERAQALEMGYDQVVHHPNLVGRVQSDDVLRLDFDHPSFGDHSAVVALAFQAAQDGVQVGIYTFHPHHPLLEPLTRFPNVTIAKTHRELRGA